MLARRITRGAISGLAILTLVLLATTLASVAPKHSRWTAWDPAAPSRTLIPDAAAAGTKWEWVQLKWADGKDTTLIQDEADTNRTVRLPTDIAWEEVGQAWGAAGAVTGIEIRVEGPKVNAAMESLYCIVEPCSPGICARSSPSIGMAGAAVLTPYGAGSTALAANYTWSAGTAAYSLVTPPCISFMGRINWDTDTDQGVATHWLRNARLNIFGDIGGTTPQLNAARVYVYVPRRAQP